MWACRLFPHAIQSRNRLSAEWFGAFQRPSIFAHSCGAHRRKISPAFLLFSSPAVQSAHRPPWLRYVFSVFRDVEMVLNGDGGFLVSLIDCGCLE